MLVGIRKGRMFFFHCMEGTSLSKALSGSYGWLTMG